MILYNSVKLHRELEKKNVIERLEKLGVKHNRNGVSIQKLDYRELVFLLALQNYIRTDVESTPNSWF